MPDHNKVQRIMQDKDITKSELARRMNMPRSNVVRLVDKDANANEDMILRMCRALGCKPNDIMREVWEA